MEDIGYGLYFRNNLYKSLNVYAPLCIDELPQHVNIEGCSLTMRLLSQEQ